ncbi:copper resistance protein C [Frankia sp. AiPs1]
MQFPAAGRRQGRFRPIGHTVAGLAAVLTALVAALAVPASAHSRLELTSPAAGAILAQAPGEVVLTFNEAVSSRYTRVAVTSPDGTAHTRGDPQVQGTSVHQALSALGNGRYTVAYQAVSADGHPVGGTFDFTVAQAAALTPAPAASATPDATATAHSAAPATTSPVRTGAGPIASVSSSPTGSAAGGTSTDSAGGNGTAWTVAGAVVLAATLAGGAAYLVRRRRPGAH